MQRPQELHKLASLQPEAGVHTPKLDYTLLPTMRSPHQGACLAIAKWCYRGNVEAWLGSVSVIRVCTWGFFFDVAASLINFEARDPEPF